MKTRIYLSVLLFCMNIVVYGEKVKEAKQYKNTDSLMLSPILRDFTANIFQFELLLDFDHPEINKSLTNFSLARSPEGMFIYEDIFLAWVPPESAEGNSYNILINEVNGESIKHHEFTIRVAKTKKLNYVVKNNFINIKASDCISPNNESIDFSLYFEDELNFTDARPVLANYKMINKAINLRKIISGTNYSIPSNIKVLSCFFTMGGIKIPDTKKYWKREYENKFTVYPSVKTSSLEGAVLFNFTSRGGATDGGPPSSIRSEWLPSYSQGNGLFFVGRYMERKK